MQRRVVVCVDIALRCCVAANMECPPTPTPTPYPSDDERSGRSTTERCVRYRREVVLPMISSKSHGFWGSGKVHHDGPLVPHKPGCLIPHKPTVSLPKTIDELMRNATLQTCRRLMREDKERDEATQVA